MLGEPVFRLDPNSARLSPVTGACDSVVTLTNVVLWMLNRDPPGHMSTKRTTCELDASWTSEPDIAM